AMLLFVSHVVLGRLESRRWLKFLERRTVEAARGGERVAGAPPWPLAAVAFVAAYREAIEVVLFFRALVLDAPGRAGAVALRTLLSVSLVGQGIRALQEGGYLGLTPLGEGVPSLPSLGLYATAEGLAVQALVLLMVAVPWWLERRRRPPAGAAKLA